MQFLLPLAVAVFESQTLFSLPFFHSHFLYLCSSTYLFFFFVFILVYWLLYNLSFFFFLLHYHQYLRYSLVNCIRVSRSFDKCVRSKCLALCVVSCFEQLAFALYSIHCHVFLYIYLFIEGTLICIFPLYSTAKIIS